ncbi:hypothetical protein PFLG_02656 [Plasmodium falciparum RAJ116]|uniref:Uncharacterized protein n=1 Tax=Plasmodium falciparum RAJ116 TaxID=580058 RepID=A0A0L0CZP5_PLAFA|nr:hypothetical protein PFLG_02656 [Plasmodium falciparum RAJ116]
MFYNYKYNYNVEYVTRQYMFNLSMKGDDTYYSLLKRYYGEKKKNKIKYGHVGNYDNNSNHSDDDNNNKNHCDDNNNKNHCDDNNNNKNHCDDNNNNKNHYVDNNNNNNHCGVYFKRKRKEKNVDNISYHNIVKDFFLDVCKYSKDYEKEKLYFMSKLYTCMIYCCYILIKNKYYLDFFCLYLLLKSYFFIDTIIINKYIVLPNFTCHKKFLRLLFLLCNICNYKDTGENYNIYNEERIQDTHNNICNDLYYYNYTNNIEDSYGYKNSINNISYYHKNKIINRKHFYLINKNDDDNINIGNIQFLSFNLLFYVPLKINFNEMNFINFHTLQYKSLCNYILSFQNSYTRKFLLDLNKVNNITFKCKEYFFKKTNLLTEKKNNNNIFLFHNDYFPSLQKRKIKHNNIFNHKTNIHDEHHTINNILVYNLSSIYVFTKIC